MKKVLLSLIAVMLVVVPASAQFYPDGRPIPPSKRGNYRYAHRDNRYRDHGNCQYADTYYGFRMGLGIGTVNSDSKYLDGSDAKTGLNVGFAIGTRIAPVPLYFESGLYYTEKGGKSKIDGSKFTYGLDYLEVPLVFKYKIFASPDVSIEPFMGGFLSCGVAGKIKDFNQREAYHSFDSDIDPHFHRFDGGVRLGCGASFQMLYVEASYDIGLANVGNDDFDDTHTGCFNLTIGLNF